MREVSYKAFVELARQRGWTAAFLTERFKGKIEEPRQFFEQVFKASDRADGGIESAVPYRSVIEFYEESLSGSDENDPQVCACGCGRRVFGRKKSATAACRKRLQRRG